MPMLALTDVELLTLHHKTSLKPLCKHHFLGNAGRTFGHLPIMHSNVSLSLTTKLIVSAPTQHNIQETIVMFRAA